MELMTRRKIATYNALKKLMYENGLRFNKKHGNYLVRYAPKNQVLIMDTWNGSIQQGHCTTELINGQFGPEGKVEYHSRTRNPENDWEASSVDLDETVDMYKTMLSSL